MNIIPNLCERILALDPLAQCSCRENDYDTLIWNANNVNPAPPSAAACAALDFVTHKRDKRRQHLKAELQDEPMLATILQALIPLKAAADGTTNNVAKNAILAMLEAKIT